MRWVCTKEEAEYMRMRQRENKERFSAAEEWMYEKLLRTKYKWTRQAMWGYRLFDFWCHELGIAIEVDGPEHDPKYDFARDQYNFCRSALLVLRVRNFNEPDAEEALACVNQSISWPERKRQVKPGKALLASVGLKPARSAKEKLPTWN